MEPEIFYLNEEYCCLAYRDCLVVNLPEAKIAATISFIDDGRSESVYKRFWKLCVRYFFFGFYLAGPAGGFFSRFLPIKSVVFKLDKHFSAGIRGDGLFLVRFLDIITGNFAKQNYVDRETGCSLYDWLTEALVQRGFSSSEKYMSKKGEILTWLAAFIIVFLILLITGYEEFLANPAEELLLNFIGSAFLTLLYLVFFRIYSRFSGIKGRTLIRYSKK